jgi:hypothetical protein
MILLHRITPFLVLSVGFAAFLPLILTDSGYGFLVFLLCAVLIGVFLLRLLNAEYKTVAFWFFLGTPLMLLVSSVGYYLFLENVVAQWSLAVFVGLALFFYAEHLFHYHHLPSRYQPYTLEYLSVIFHVITLFFLSVIGFGGHMFLHLPVWFLGCALLVISFFMIHGILWVSKVEQDEARIFALAGSVLVTELFLVMTFLPVGFYTSATLLTIFFYCFLGMFRAHFAKKLTKGVARRYVLISLLLFVMLVASAQWT